jgi:hypothetical protein
LRLGDVELLGIPYVRSTRQPAADAKRDYGSADSEARYEDFSFFGTVADICVIGLFTNYLRE